MCKKPAKTIIKIFSAFSEVCSLLCLCYIIYLPHSSDGIFVLRIIDLFGSLAQRVLLLGVFSAVSCDILLFGRKQK